ADDHARDAGVPLRVVVPPKGLDSEGYVCPETVDMGPEQRDLVTLTERVGRDKPECRVMANHEVSTEEKPDSDIIEIVRDHPETRQELQVCLLECVLDARAEIGRVAEQIDLLPFVHWTDFVPVDPCGVCTDD